MKTYFITAALLVLIAGIPLSAGATSDDNHSNYGHNQARDGDWGSSGYGNNDHSNYGGGKSGGSFGWLAHHDDRYDHGYGGHDDDHGHGGGHGDDHGGGHGDDHGHGGGHGGHDDDHDASACHRRH
jgi:hypothetical protein